ncbi:hypothetical protein HBH98_224930 [Parastagonospora nodorum]|nr:hypothetical protein HBI09_063250 [Parastagonospora nodorum]KAH4174603.1 hypothetical protein HBH43_078480 [Parastagonospora nodorum]KAH4210941.1 hypothetical protein HBI95_066490 [Parastagonospora nodorum]KAH4336632.1 hypothetical protein HBH98_224930 [Parastagonospora nodorum]KAH4366067.1 hypothetical protein HBH97_170050 [Parastagonospora nodorum]
MDGCKDMMLKEAHDKMIRKRHDSDAGSRKRRKKNEGTEKKNRTTSKTNANKNCLKALNASRTLPQSYVFLQSTAPAVVPNVSTSAQPHNSTPPQKPP